MAENPMAQVAAESHNVASSNLLVSPKITTESQIYASLNELRQTFGSRSFDRNLHSPVRHVQQVQASTACNQKGTTMSDITLSTGIRQNLAVAAANVG